MRLANPQIEGAEQLQPWERKRNEVQEQRKKAAREKLEAEGAAGSSADAEDAATLNSASSSTNWSSPSAAL
ncbi:helicase [Aureococcus anophagefferens]|nr:helicase [Aureococcus anophagefferens]